MQTAVPLAVLEILPGVHPAHVAKVVEHADEALAALLLAAAIGIYGSGASSRGTDNEKSPMESALPVSSIQCSSNVL